MVNNGDNSSDGHDELFTVTDIFSVVVELLSISTSSLLCECMSNIVQAGAARLNFFLSTKWVEKI